MSDPHTPGQPVEDDDSIGYEGYPFASVESEKRIKLITSSMSLIALAILVGGLYLALFTPQVGTGGILSTVGFFALMFVPFVAKRLRRAALAREAGQA